ncbi:hypothetical protein LAZ67_9001914 [Cordylochernes scorpioides]|uniref:Uncharacterized protein n=1 Tax=Cordylochernes scorpioides TaxID=51811 RepID=A0ABY6KU25_9ARAC|nr:hypothetical protein LAZ67_9001914 [Cordylochernes scorpioides]
MAHPYSYNLKVSSVKENFIGTVVRVRSMLRRKQRQFSKRKPALRSRVGRGSAHPELRFTKRITETSYRTQNKIRLMKHLCSSKWGSKAQNLTKEKLNRVQAKAEKLFIGAVSSTNNSKAEKESVLQDLEERRQLSAIKYINKIRSCNKNHISQQTYKSWNNKNRLHRSSPLQQDNEIRSRIGLEHLNTTYYEQPETTSNFPPNTTLSLHLIEPCTKKDPPNNLKEKALIIISLLKKEDHAIAYTDGSSDETLNN